MSFRPVRRADFGHRVYGAAAREPQIVALPDPTGGRAWTVSSHRERFDRPQLRWRIGFAESIAMESAADSHGSDGFRARTRDGRWPRLVSRAERLCHLLVCRQPVDAKSIFL